MTTWQEDMDDFQKFHPKAVEVVKRVDRVALEAQTLNGLQAMWDEEQHMHYHRFSDFVMEVMEGVEVPQKDPTDDY